MADLAKYVRIYDAAPGDDLVAKREQAVKDAVTALRKLTTTAVLVELGSAASLSFTNPATPDPLGAKVANAIKSKAPSFIREERELEVSVLAAVAMIDFLEGPENQSSLTVKDFIGAALWSALSFQAPIGNAKHEQLRQDLLGIAQTRSLLRAEASRKRTVPKESPDFAEGEPAQVAKTLNGVRATVTALETNAVLDREELDILWWALGGRSPILEMAYDSLDAAPRGLVRGIELGVLTRRLPSQSMRSLVLSGVPETVEMTLADLLESVQVVIETLASRIPARDTVAAYPAVFPLLSSIIANEATAGGQAMSGDQWCSRAMLETGLANLCENPNSKL